MTRMKRARCPTCKVNVDTDPETRPKDYPFCSERCRMLDLSKWLDGDYRISSTHRRGLDPGLTPENE